MPGGCRRRRQTSSPKRLRFLVSIWLRKSQPVVGTEHCFFENQTIIIVKRCSNWSFYSPGCIVIFVTFTICSCPLWLFKFSSPATTWKVSSECLVRQKVFKVCCSLVVCFNAWLMYWYWSQVTCCSKHVHSNEQQWGHVLSGWQGATIGG